MTTKSLARVLISKISRTHINITNRTLLNSANIKFYSAAASRTDFQYIKSQNAGTQNNVGLITLNRPKQLNAISNGLMLEVADAIDTFERDDTIGAIVITGGEKIFAAGADVKELVTYTFSQCVKENFLAHYNRIAETVKPVIAAVNGLVFGFGCEMAMMCDIVYAGESAKFGQPEILIGTFPGGGGTQRLPRAVGKSKAMEIVLSGTPISAQEAEKMGLISKVFPDGKVIEEAIKVGEKIAKNSHVINAICKESINAAFETTLRGGIHFERRMADGTFATKDRKEGMTAFVEKRPPKFTNE